MSREINFRVWAKRRKGYRELDQLVLNNQGLEEIWVFPKDGEMQQVYHPSEVIIEQYTGLKDKNGKEIYEGDIVSIRNKNHKNECDIGVVEFGKGAFRCPFLLGKYQPGQVEAIGNIHENPELLGGEE